jgi:hypothetical protein
MSIDYRPSSPVPPGGSWPGRHKILTAPGYKQIARLLTEHPDQRPGRADDGTAGRWDRVATLAGTRRPKEDQHRDLIQAHDPADVGRRRGGRCREPLCEAQPEAPDQSRGARC